MPSYNKKKYKSKRTKWRQQKLAVGTVAKIAKKVALKLDRKHFKYLISNVFHAKDGYNWYSNNNILSLPSTDNWRPINNGALESQIISDISGTIQDTSTTVTADQKDVSLRIAGVQSRIIMSNPNRCSVNYSIMIVFIPNLNDNTTQSVDFLRPDQFMMYKTGTGNVLYDGFAKKSISNVATGGSSVRKYRILVQKTGTIKGTHPSGFAQAGPNPPVIIPIPGMARKTVYLTKYFKKERKANCKYLNVGTTPSKSFTDGNYYLLMHTDLAPSEITGTDRHILYCGASSLKVRLVGTTGSLST